MGKRVAFAVNALTGMELSGGKQDATRVYHMLIAPELGNCDSHLSPPPLYECATRNAFTDALADVLREWNPDDQLVFYFSGHGALRNQLYSFVLGSDPPEYVLFDTVIGEIRANSVRRALLIIDTCFAGAAIEKGQKSIDPAMVIDEEGLPNGIAILTSCRAREVSHELPNSSESIFTRLLCEAIETGLWDTPTPGGRITVGEVVEAVGKRLRTEDEYLAIAQTPLFAVLGADSDIWIALNGSGDSLADSATTEVGAVGSLEQLELAYKNTAQSQLPHEGATADCLDWEVVEQYIKACRPDLSASEDDREKIAEELGLFSPLRTIPRLLHKPAVLCFCRRPEDLIPQARSMFVVGDPADVQHRNVSVSGPLSLQIERLVESTMDALGKVSRFDSGGARTETDEIPISVVRELISNAMAHRDYRQSGVVQVKVTSETLEVRNPGAFPEPWSWESFIESEMVSCPADPAIALYLTRLVRFEGVGRGFRIFRQFIFRNGRDSMTCQTLPGPTVLIRVRRPRYELPSTPNAVDTTLSKPLTVMISSTARDLPDHRQGVLDACLRLGMLPKMMEHLPAEDADAIEASMAMVDEADVYLGIFAHRYGYVPEGQRNSIPQLEYERACQRKIPRLIFLMHDDHPIRPADVEVGPASERLEKLKERLRKQRVVNFFKSPEELKGQVIQSLAAERIKHLETENATGAEAAIEAARSLHSSVDIPTAPEPYIAHQFPLLRTRTGLIGRREELNLLTDWIVRRETVGHARVFSMVAIGGQGKSALAWHWFNQIAPNELTGPRAVDGRLWWSFYESDATHENFVIRAVAYVTGRPSEEVRKTPLSECEDLLLGALDQRPFLVVLDGLERILLAYAGMHAAYVQDEEAAQAEQERRLRQTIDPRAGRFLRKLAAVRGSRVLITTRLFPAVLEGPSDLPIHGVVRYDLPGLSDNDALALWRSFEVTGARDEMLRLFRRFENHPLLIQVMAAKVAHDRQHPRDFDAWRAANPGFDPFSLDMTHVRAHILEAAMTGLSEREAYVLHVIAAFRMPAGYDTLCALLVGDGPRKYPDQSGLIAAFSDLEDRGLLGWDNRPGVNRYDLHPIVRGVTWSRVPDDARQAIYGTLEVHFKAMPKVEFDDVNSLEDLTPAIELYDKLIGLERYDDALVIFRDRLEHATLYRLSASRQRVELLERLFPDGTDALPRLNSALESWALNALAQGYQLSGQPGAAVSVLGRKLGINRREGEEASLAVGLCNLSEALRLSGDVRSAESSAREALIIGRKRDDRFGEGVNLRWLGLAFAARGMTDDADGVLRRSLQIWASQGNRGGEGRENAYLAEVALWMGDPVAARPLADRAWELAAVDRYEADFIRAARLQGTAALLLGGPGDLEIADERLHHALTRARACSLVEEGLPALVALAELHRRQGEPETAREVLEDVWDPAERGPYPMFHADGLNLLAQIERDTGNPEAAVAAAKKAFELAWCDGPPFAYHWGLEAARKHLAELGAAEPDLPAFDESKFEPMPEVEIDPRDEFAD